MKGKKWFPNKSEVLSLVSYNVKRLHASKLFQLLCYIAEVKKRND